MGNIKVLFIAGFGPIVHDASLSREMYNQILGIGFKEEDGDYLHTETLEGAKTFALWPLSQARTGTHRPWAAFKPARELRLFHFESLGRLSDSSSTRKRKTSDDAGACPSERFWRDDRQVARSRRLKALKPGTPIPQQVRP